jgi:Na+/H+ antiporter NhaD/arsenite permease-like protein
MFRALSIFAITYLLMSKPHWPFVQLDRPTAELVGAVLMIATGALTPAEAYHAVDCNTIVLLLGMLLLSGSLRLAGFFEWAAGIVLTHVHTPTALLTVLVFVSGLLSAFLVNDTVAKGIELEIQQFPVLSETVATGGFPARDGDEPRPAAVHG